MPVVYLRDSGQMYKITFKAGSYYVRTGTHSSMASANRWENIPLKNIAYYSNALVHTPVKVHQDKTTGEWVEYASGHHVAGRGSRPRRGKD